jgi:hypothetical protein
MGLGSTASVNKDFLESLVIEEPNNAADRYCNAVHGFMLRHREALGLPAGAASFPYFVCSNDLVKKLSGLVDIVGIACKQDAENKDARVADMRRDMNAVILHIVDLLLETYDACGSDASNCCCKMWHSAQKDEMQQLRQELVMRFDAAV